MKLNENIRIASACSRKSDVNMHTGLQGRPNPEKKTMNKTLINIIIQTGIGPCSAQDSKAFLMYKISFKLWMIICNLIQTLVLD